MKRASGFRLTVGVLFGPIVWAFHFSVVYGGYAYWHAAAGRSAMTDVEPPVLLLATATAIALCLAALPLFLGRTVICVGVASGEEAGFLLSLARWLGALSLFAIAAAAVAMLVML